MPQLGITSREYVGSISTINAGYAECRTVRNHTSVDICFADYTGSVNVVHPSGCATGEVVIEYVYRGSSDKPLPSMPGLHGNVCKCMIKESHLQSKVVNLPELGLWVTSIYNRDELIETMGQVAGNIKINDIGEYLSATNCIQGAYYLNTHDPEVNCAWMISDDRVVPLSVRHEKQEAEMLRYSYLTAEGVYCGDDVPLTTFKDMSFAKHCDSAGDKTVIFGTDKNKLISYLEKKRAALANSKTKEEVEDIVRLRLQHKQNEIDELNRELEAIKTKLQNTKSELDNSKWEVSQINTGAAQTFEKQSMDLKLQVQQQEAANIVARNQVALEQQRLAIEASRAKAEADLAVNQAKVYKEQLSVESSRANTAGTLVKAAAVAVPAAVGLGAWLASAAKTAALVSSVAAPIAAPVAATCAIAAGATKAAKPVLNALAKYSKKGVSAIKKAASWVGSGIKKVAGGVWSAVKSGASWIGEKLSNVGSWLFG